MAVHHGPSKGGNDHVHIIVTRATTDADMGSDVIAQFARQRQSLRTGGVVVCLLAIVPGLPKVPFLVVGGAVLLIASRLPKEDATAGGPDALDAADVAPPQDPSDAIRSEMRVEPLELEIAYDLVDLVDASRGGDLLDRVRALRRKLALELGMVIPLVRTRDNLDLPPHTYTIRVHGVEMGRGEAPPGTVLAISEDLSGLPGIPTTETVFGLAARWVPIELRQQAEVLGATVGRPPSGPGPLEASLGGDHDVIGVRMECLGDQRLTHRGTVGVGGVDEVDPELHHPAEDGLGAQDELPSGSRGHIRDFSTSSHVRQDPPRAQNLHWRLNGIR